MARYIIFCGISGKYFESTYDDWYVPKSNFLKEATPSPAFPTWRPGMKTLCYRFMGYYELITFGVFFQWCEKKNTGICISQNGENIKIKVYTISKLEFLQHNNVSFVTLKVFLTKLCLFISLKCLLVFFIHFNVETKI